MANYRPITELPQWEKTILKNFNKLYKEVISEWSEAADYAVKSMRTIIRAGKRQSKGDNTLENSLNVTVTQKTAYNYSIGIGNIPDLPKYWRIINYGGMISPKARHLTGYFLGGGNKGPFVFTGKKTAGKSFAGQTARLYHFNKPIKGKFYIERSMIKLRLMLFAKNKKLAGRLRQLGKVSYTSTLGSYVPKVGNIGLVKYKK